MFESVTRKYWRLFFEKKTLALYIFTYRNLLSQAQKNMPLRKHLLKHAQAELVNFKTTHATHDQRLRQLELNKDPQDLDVFDQQLQAALNITYKHREKLSDWPEFVKKEQAEDLKDLFALFKPLKNFLNSNKGRNVFTADTLQKFQEIAKQILYRILGLQSATTEKAADEVSLLRLWLVNLNKLQTTLSQSNNSKEDFSYAIEVVDVLSKRSSFDAAFYASRQSDSALIDECLLAAQEQKFDEDSDFLEWLTAQRNTLRTKIQAMENTLKPTDDLSNFVAHGVCLWKKTPHFVITKAYGDALIRNLNRLTRETWIKNIPNLGENLEPELLAQLIQIGVSLFSVAWFGNDVYYSLVDEAGFLFLSLPHANSLLPLSSIASMMALVLVTRPELFESFGIDRRTFTTQVLPWLQDILRAGTHTLFQCISKGFSWVTALSSLLNYTLAQTLANSVLNIFYKNSTPLEQHNRMAGVALISNTTFMASTFLWSQASQQSNKLLTKGWERFALLGQAGTRLLSNNAVPTEVLNHTKEFGLGH